MDTLNTKHQTPGNHPMSRARQSGSAPRRPPKKSTKAVPVPPPNPPPQSHVSPEQRGKELRQKCPRSSHAGVILGQKHRDPLALLEESNQDRFQDLLPIRFTRMSESAFAFFRGSAILQA